MAISVSAESANPVDSVITAVTRRADRYVDILERAVRGNSLRTEEADLLDRFERYTADILDHHWPTGPRRRESLAFALLYEPVDAVYVPQDAVSRDDWRRALITALIAADVESRGPLRLTRQQSSRLAAVFVRIGENCRREELLLHAALAFDRAAGIYLSLGENRVRDHCLFDKNQCKRTAMEPGWTKVLDTINWALTGYGYQPYRLLLWVMVQLAVFGTAFTVLTAPIVSPVTNHQIGIWKSIYMFLTNFLNPLGFGDTVNLTFAANGLLVTESYLGAVSLSVFFALLVRRWFQT